MRSESIVFRASERARMSGVFRFVKHWAEVGLVLGVGGNKHREEYGLWICKTVMFVD